MSTETENKLVPAAGEAGPAASGGSGTSAALVRSEGEEEAPEEEVPRDRRLDRLQMQLDVLVKVRAFRVQDLLALTKGSVLETVHLHTQDVPVSCAGALLVWGEFEVMEQKLGVRITRLA